MINSKTKFFIELVFLTVLLFLIFISTWYKNIVFDSDGVKLFSMVCFIMSIDLCIYAYRNLFNNKK
jgi:glycerol uptake facilitator-like aquaporin